MTPSLTQRDRGPRAQFVTSEVQAAGVLCAAHTTALEMPEDLAIVSFDGAASTAFAEPCQQ